MPGTCGSQKQELGSLDLELQMVVRDRVGIKPKSSGGAAGTLSCWATQNSTSTWWFPLPYKYRDINEREGGPKANCGDGSTFHDSKLPPSLLHEMNWLPPQVGCHGKCCNTGPQKSTLPDHQLKPQKRKRKPNQFISWWHQALCHLNRKLTITLSCIILKQKLKFFLSFSLHPKALFPELLKRTLVITELIYNFYVVL